MMKEIILTHGQVTIVDDDVYEELSWRKWRAVWKPNTETFYVYSSRGKENSLLMHREIMKAKYGTLVDHINGDTLDNRRENLRIVTTRQNQQNRHRGKSSIYPGVSIKKATSKWQATIVVNKVKIHLGYYKLEIDAFNAYLSACSKYGFPVDQMLDKFMA